MVQINGKILAIIAGSGARNYYRDMMYEVSDLEHAKEIATAEEIEGWSRSVQGTNPRSLMNHAGKKLSPNKKKITGRWTPAELETSDMLPPIVKELMTKKKEDALVKIIQVYNLVEEFQEEARFVEKVRVASILVSIDRLSKEALRLSGPRPEMEKALKAVEEMSKAEEKSQIGGDAILKIIRIPTFYGQEQVEKFVDALEIERHSVWRGSFYRDGKRIDSETIFVHIKNKKQGALLAARSEREGGIEFGGSMRKHVFLEEKQQKPIQCTGCAKLGHVARKCPERKDDDEKTVICFKCLSKNHTAKQCSSDAWKCANCGQAHKTNTRACAEYHKSWIQVQSKNEKRKNKLEKKNRRGFSTSGREATRHASRLDRRET